MQDGHHTHVPMSSRRFTERDVATCTGGKSTRISRAHTDGQAHLRLSLLSPVQMQRMRVRRAAGGSQTPTSLWMVSRVWWGRLRACKRSGEREGQSMLILAVSGRVQMAPTPVGVAPYLSVICFALAPPPLLSVLSTPLSVLSPSPVASVAMSSGQVGSCV